MNDGMGKYVAGQVVKMMIKAGKPVKGAKILMLGITFKENCPDIRNTRAIDIVRELTDYGIEVTIYDPWAKPEEVLHEYSVPIIAEFPEGNGYAAIILAVAHKEFLSIDLTSFKSSGTLIYDVKGILPEDVVDGRL